MIGVLAGVAPLLGWSKYVKTKPDRTYCSLDFEDKSAASLSYFVTVNTIIFVLTVLLTACFFVHIVMELKSTASETKIQC